MSFNINVSRLLNRKGIEIILFWIILATTSFFGFYVLVPGADQFYTVDFSMICLLFFSLVYVVAVDIKKTSILYVHGTYTVILFLLVILSLIEFIMSRIRYGQPLMASFKDFIYYTATFIVYMAFIIDRNDRVSVKTLADYLVKFSIATSIISLFLYYAYTYLHKNIINLNDTDSGNFRNGTIRFTIGATVIVLGMIISMTRAIQRQVSRIDIVNIILGVINLLLVSKTRTIIAYIFVIICINAAFGKRTNGVVRFLSVLGLIFSVIYLISQGVTLITTSVNDLVNSDIGVRHRIYTIDFYWKQFVGSPWWGMGFISGDKAYPNWDLASGDGKRGTFYRDDVGIIGTLNEFGMIGAIWMIAFFITIWYKVTRYSVQDNDPYLIYREIIKNILIYMAISLINLSFMDPPRVMMIAFVTLLADSYIYEVKVTHAKK